MEYSWMEEAKKHIGLAEIPGSKHNVTILSWLKNLKAWWSDDETPWCGTYCAHCIKTAGLDIPKLYMRAKEWETWGIGLTKPTYGCIVTFNRQGGGHVGFVIGETEDGFLAVLGGNQGNKVSIAKFDKTRVTSYRWPKAIALPEQFTMPKINLAGNLSTNEA